MTLAFSQLTYSDNCILSIKKITLLSQHNIDLAFVLDQNANYISTSHLKTKRILVCLVKVKASLICDKEYKLEDNKSMMYHDRCTSL